MIDIPRMVTVLASCPRCNGRRCGEVAAYEVITSEGCVEEVFVHQTWQRQPWHCKTPLRITFTLCTDERVARVKCDGVRVPCKVRYLEPKNEQVIDWDSPFDS